MDLLPQSLLIQENIHHPQGRKTLLHKKPVQKLQLQALHSKPYKGKKERCLMGLHHHQYIPQYQHPLDFQHQLHAMLQDEEKLEQLI